MADLKAIKKEILRATGITLEPGEKEQAFLARIVRAVVKLPDAKWEALSVEAQDWQNEAIDRLNDKKKPALIGFGDFDDAEPPEDEAPARRSRRSAEPDPEPEGPKDPEVGDTVTITVNGEKIKGEVVEIDAKNIVLDVDGEEEPFRRAKVAAIKVHGAAKPADDEPPAPKDPVVGDMVEVTLNDGEILKGELIEIDEKNIVLEIDGEEEPYRRSKVKSIKVAPAKAAARGRASKDEGVPIKEEDEERAANSRSRRGAAKDEKPAGRTRASAGEDGESDVKKAWKLMSEHMDDTFEQAQKRVAKAGLTVKEGTLNIRYKDLQHAYDRFKELGLIK
jgi:ribosome maturation factor RimP